MKHPGVLGLIGFAFQKSSVDSRPVVVTEWMEKGSLENAIKMERCRTAIDGWTPTKKSCCIFGIAAIMQYLHKHGVIHRDLNTANVLLNNNCEPIISDFPISSLRINSPAKVGNVPTALFIAPELFIDQENDSSTKVDVYSYGLILYRMFTDNVKLDDDPSRPWKTYQQYLIRVKNGARLIRVPGISDFYWNLIKSCWNADPQSRPTFDQIVWLLKRDVELIPGTDCKILEEYENRILGFTKADLV
jgi:serine/threonine protein kinase